MYSEPMWKDKLDLARRLIDISQKRLAAGDDHAALEAVRHIFFSLGDAVRNDFMTAMCPCGHPYSEHRPLNVPEADEPEDAPLTSGLFLACAPCSKRCIEIVPVPATR